MDVDPYVLGTWGTVILAVVSYILRKLLKNSTCQMKVGDDDDDSDSSSSSSSSK